jgi:hypothetical protein
MRLRHALHPTDAAQSASDFTTDLGCTVGTRRLASWPCSVAVFREDGSFVSTAPMSAQTIQLQIDI